MATAFSVLAAPVHSETGVVVISIESDGRVSEVSRRRLEGYLQAEGCRAQVRFNGDDPATALVFRSGVAASGAPVLVAVSRDGGLPVPAWITRRTAGVKAIGELLGRDLSTVAGGDPVGAELPLAALRQAGVVPETGQLYEAGDYSSALGLLLHNNTHASVSELGFVRPLLEKNDLVITWAGEPLTAAGWYRETGWTSDAGTCEQALSRWQRGDDRQAFAAFPEWVNGFAWPDSLNSEDSNQ